MIIFFGALAALYFIFLVWLRNGLAATVRKATSGVARERPSVAIIVAARNEEKTMGSLLQHLLQQSYPEDLTEIVVVNDNSSDGTGDIVDTFARHNSRVRHVPAGKSRARWSPKKWALYTGVQVSKGDILLFTDADCTVGPEWIATMMGPFDDPRVGMVTGPSPLEKNGSLWNRMLLLDSLAQDALAAGGVVRGLPLTSSGRNLAIRRSAFEAVNGYDGIHRFISGDDDLMMHKLAARGWKIHVCANSGAEAKSPPPPTLRSFASQRLRFASKGKAYYTLPFVDGRFKWILPLIYATNLAVLVGQVLFVVTLQSPWLLPWFLKMLADGILITQY
ncbi:MAG: glycosyltransferase, partial [Fidelibacterota bacterium]